MFLCKEFVVPLGKGSNFFWIITLPYFINALLCITFSSEQIVNFLNDFYRMLSQEKDQFWYESVSKNFKTENESISTLRKTLSVEQHCCFWEISIYCNYSILNMLIFITYQYIRFA